jgi:hypothetical protein
MNKYLEELAEANNHQTQFKKRLKRLLDDWITDDNETWG